MKKARAIVVSAVMAVGLAFTLTGCFNGADSVGGVRTETDTGWVTAQKVALPDGGEVVCVMSNTKISCDWAGVKR